MLICGALPGNDVFTALPWVLRRACTARRPVGPNAAWQRYAVAAPGNWVWVYGLIAILKPGHQETWVDYDQDRAPLLFIGGEKAAKKFSGFPASARQTFRAVYEVMLNLTRVLDEAGVPMLAGSDSGGAAWEVPGLALHQEFDELARAALSPLRVLQMTTWNAAEFMNATDVMGSVAAGKHADLVLLDANPVESVDHLHRICGVVRGGRYIGPAELDALKDKVAATRSGR